MAQWNIFNVVCSQKLNETWFGLCLEGGGFDSTGGDEGEDCASAWGSPEVSSLLGPTLDLFGCDFMLLSVTPGRMVSY